MNTTSLQQTIERLDSSVNNNPVLMNVMSKEQIMAVAPHVYDTKPTNDKLSKYYVMASTEQVIADMENLGWEVVKANQIRPRHRKTTNSFHMVVFQNKAIKLVKNSDEEEIVEAYPRIILTNSHDGFSSFCFRVGMYNIATGYTSIFSSENLEAFRIRHMGYTFEELRNLINDLINAIPTYIDVINNMKTRELTLDEQYEIALEAIRVRQNNPEYKCSHIVLDSLLTADNAEDFEKTDLWTIFNIIQTKMMNGAFQILGRNGKPRKARAIKSIRKEISLNQGLFKAAAKFI